jgi:CheY-like chemotaxis protein
LTDQSLGAEEKEMFSVPREFTHPETGSETQSVVLIAEDDEDDFLLIKEACREAGLVYDLHWVKDGEELIDYLFRLDERKKSGETAYPGLIILDLNMPKVSGFEALREIKTHPSLRKIPIIILTTSQSEDDVVQAYDLGVNSFIQKPIRFESMVDVFRTMDRYWFKVVKLPRV